MSQTVWCDTGPTGGHPTLAQGAITVTGTNITLHFCPTHLDDAFAAAITRAEHTGTATITVPAYGAFTLTPTGPRQRRPPKPATHTPPTPAPSPAPASYGSRA
jgi:hypothetical protein